MNKKLMSIAGSGVLALALISGVVYKVMHKGGNTVTPGAGVAAVKNVKLNPTDLQALQNNQVLPTYQKQLESEYSKFTAEIPNLIKSMDNIQNQLKTEQDATNKTALNQQYLQSLIKYSSAKSQAINFYKQKYGIQDYVPTAEEKALQDEMMKLHSPEKIQAMQKMNDKERQAANEQDSAKMAEIHKKMQDIRQKNEANKPKKSIDQQMLERQDLVFINSIFKK